MLNSELWVGLKFCFHKRCRQLHLCCLKPCGEKKGKEFFHRKLENKAVMKLICYALYTPHLVPAPASMMWDCCRVFQLGNEASMYIRAHYSREKLHRPWDKMGRKWFVTARLVQELLCLQGQISMGLAWEAARWGLKWREKRLCLYNTISRETNGVKRGWIWIKSPINVHFSPVWVLHIQLKLSEAVSWQSCHYKSSRTKLHQVLKMRRVKMSREHDRRPGHDFQ